MIKYKSLSFRLAEFFMSIITTTNIVEAKSISVVDLMQGKNELILIHSKQRYVLRITRNGKLILTK